MKLTKLKYNPDNPRRISPEQLDRLIKSIESLPKMMELRPIVYDPDTMHILGGNQRLAALRKMGKTEIPDNWVKSAEEMTEKEKREFILRDNVQSGEWDFGVLEENFADFDLDDIGIELPDSFGIDEPEVTEDDYEQPAQIETDIVLGDLFSLRKDGKEIHRLLCGDATKKEDVDRLMGGVKADMLLTDPPYGVAYKTIRDSGFSPIENDQLTGDDLSEFNKTWMENFPTFCGEGSPKYVFCDWRNLGKTIDLLEALGEEVGTVIVWNKKTSSHNFIHWNPVYELIIYCGKQKKQDHRCEYNVWECGREFRADHPTPKPVELLGKPISRDTDKNNLVVDCFLGSGSTMVACHQLGRKCYGMEIDPTYCQVSLDRMRKLDPDIEVVKIDG